MENERHLIFLGMVLCASILCVQKSAATEGDAETTVAHRREVRRALADESTHQAALAAALLDPDPAIRRYASFMKRECDPNRPAGVRQLHRTNIPLSQDPANDHEVSSVLSVCAERGVFLLPGKPAEMDGIELWFAPLPMGDSDLQFWLNGIYLGQYHRSGPGDGQEFRLNAAAESVWGGTNRLVIKDGAGVEVFRPFTAEVVKCGH